MILREYYFGIFRGKKIDVVSKIDFKLKAREFERTSITKIVCNNGDMKGFITLPTNDIVFIFWWSWVDFLIAMPWNRNKMPSNEWIEHNILALLSRPAKSYARIPGVLDLSRLQPTVKSCLWYKKLQPTMKIQATKLVWFGLDFIEIYISLYLKLSKGIFEKFKGYVTYVITYPT